MNTRETYFILCCLVLFVVTYLIHIQINIKTANVNAVVFNSDSKIFFEEQFVISPKNELKNEKNASKPIKKHAAFQPEPIKNQDVLQPKPTKKQADFHPKSTKSSTITKVLMITAHRSGSTFLGELFNQNPESFYLFESLGGMQAEMSTLGCQLYPDAKISLLKRYYDCDAPKFVNKVAEGYQDNYRFYKTLPPNAIPMLHPYRGSCSKDQLCFRSDVDWTCDSGICRIPPASQTVAKMTGRKITNCNSCGTLGTNFISEYCSTKAIIAQKVIRLCDIDHVDRILAEIPDLKIIFLFRDPRGIFGSRKKILGVRQTAATIEHTCQYYEKSINYTGKNRDKMLYIRYEDVSLYPMRKAREIYKFINRKMPEGLINWIKKSQSVDRSKSGVRNDPYSTVRDSNYTIMKWRLENNFHEISNVQKLCPKLMDLVGYVKLDSAEDLKNLSISVVNPNPF